ncbi:hypothetical protein V1525DRAFT_390637, partial [Lipomyces kononenkoae]
IMESTRVFVDNVDTFLSRIPAIIAQQFRRSLANTYGILPVIPPTMGASV